MLADAKLGAFVAVRDPESARAFYRDRLGLRLVSEDPGALILDADGTTLRVQIVPTMTPVHYTVLGWRVTDIVEQIGQLQSAGVAMERFTGFPQDDLGVWTSPDGTRVAWFKDPSGNVLSLAQFQARAD